MVVANQHTEIKQLRDVFRLFIVMFMLLMCKKKKIEKKICVSPLWLPKVLTGCSELFDFNLKLIPFRVFLLRSSSLPFLKMPLVVRSNSKIK